MKSPFVAVLASLAAKRFSTSGAPEDMAQSSNAVNIGVPEDDGALPEGGVLSSGQHNLPQEGGQVIGSASGSPTLGGVPVQGGQSSAVQGRQSAAVQVGQLSADMAEMSENLSSRPFYCKGRKNNKANRKRR